MHSRKTLVALGVLGGAALLAAVASSFGATDGQRAGPERGADAPASPQSFGRADECQGALRRGPLRLGLDAPAPATEAARTAAPNIYGVERVRADVAARATHDRERGRQVKTMCGRFLYRRTVVVYMTFPELLPSASLSQGIVFVSRFEDGYRVWFVAH
jgi:hypothetical protein